MLRSSYLLLVIGLCGFLMFGTPQAPTDAGTIKSSPVHTTQIASGGLLAGINAFLTADKEQCATCHEEQVASFDNTAHARAWHTDSLACASCHGDATAHLKAGGGEETMVNLKKDLSPKEASEVCLGCHEKTGEQSHMRLSEHTKAGVSCIQCHNVHPETGDKVAAGKPWEGIDAPCESTGDLSGLPFQRCSRDLDAVASPDNRRGDGVFELPQCARYVASPTGCARGERSVRNMPNRKTRPVHVRAQGNNLERFLAGISRTITRQNC